MLRQSPGGKDAIQPFAHQVELLYRLFSRRPLKVLIGDEIGLGKTIEAIMLLKYLQEVGEVKKVLILVPRILVNQWEGELRRFGIEPFRIERDTIEILITKGFPDGIYLSSIDLVKRERYKHVILDVKYDLVIIDEAHRVGIVGGKKNARYIFLEELISRNPSINLVLLSATPHRGKVDDYIYRLKLVDPNLCASVNELDTEDFYKYVNGALVFRRTKLDVNDTYEKAPVFKPCEFIAYVVEASEDEKRFHELLLELLHNKLLEYYSKISKEPKGLALLLTLVAKRASSSPKAAMKTFSRILAKRGAQLMGKPEEVLKEVEKKADEVIETFFTSFEEYGEVFDEIEKSVTEDIDEILENFASEHLAPLLNENDFDKLKELRDLAQRITLKDSRLTEVVNLVKKHLGRGDRVVIFTEFKDTAEYVYHVLLKLLPLQSRRKVCLVTAVKIEPPEILSKSIKTHKYSIEDVKDWLKRGLVDVIVSTDVASEGLNLHYANIVIHYEPTWSPIKIVQRIGRVWRVGQEKNVYSYNVLLTVESDLAVFENLYGKLLSWLIAGVESKVVIGEDLRISLLKERTTLEERVDILAMPVTGNKEEKSYSEYRAIIEFIKEGKKGLETYINQILSMLNQLKNVSKKVESERVDRMITIDQVISAGLGGLCRQQAAEALRNILKSLVYIENCIAEERRDGILLVSCPSLGITTTIENLADAFKIIDALTKDVNISKPVVLLATAFRDKDLKELHLFGVTAKARDRVIYSEVVGIPGIGVETVRGVQIFNIMAEAIKNVIGVADTVSFSNNTVQSNMIAKAKAVVSRFLKHYITSPLEEYIHFVESNDLSNKHKYWESVTKPITIDAKWIGTIIFIASDTSKEVSPPPIKVEEIEKRAMEFVIEFERSSGRVSEDVSKYEHYDVRSYDPKTGEVRYIEVKGRWGPTLAVELTETEFEYAKKFGKDYWLYIVYDIGSGKPKLVMIRDPVNTVVWQPIPEYRYRLAGMKRRDVEMA